MECMQDRRDTINSLTHDVLSTQLSTQLKVFQIKIGQKTSAVECETESIEWMGIQEWPLREHLEELI